MIIDAKDTILGRLSTYAAKQVLLGNKVEVINCEECVISGKKKTILDNYVRRMHRRAPGKGPFFYRRPDMLVKRTIRGMLPFKRSRGKNAFKNVRCYIGVPENLIGQNVLTVENASTEKLESSDYLKIRDLCRAVGGKW
ncbi:MAG: 50S ribosomal protein L13 [Nanoarchaeota archaeon]